MIKEIPIFYLVLFTFFFRNTYSQPIVDFSSDVQKGCIPLIVKFKDISGGNPTQWQWDFGNGNTSVLQNPEANYTKPGVYSVRLKVIYSPNADSVFKQGHIKVFQRPGSNFSADTLSGCAPFTVTFNDESIPGSSSIKEWLWDFGDGNNSVLKQPYHTYTSKGNFTVSLIITDGNGCQDYFFRTQYIKINKPDAGFNAVTAVCKVPADISFENLSANPTSIYSWDFGDSTTAFGLNPVHTYSNFGIINVLSVVKDEMGCSDSVTKQLKIIKFQPDFDFSLDMYCDSFFTVKFTDITVPSPILWRWDFSDGKFLLEKNISHTFIDTSEEYSAKLTVTLKDGCNGSITKKIYEHPLSRFTVDTNYTCQVPFTFNFSNKSVAIAPYTGFWNFDNGTTLISNDTIVPNIYFKRETKKYNVALIISDKYNCKDTSINQVEVDPPVANFKFDPELSEIQSFFGFCPDTKKLTNESESKDPIISWKWMINKSFSDTVNWDLTFPFINQGIDTLSLIIKTEKGCSDTLRKIIKIGQKPQSIDFDIQPPDSLCITLDEIFTPVITFSDTSVKATEYCWNFDTDNSPGCAKEDYISDTSLNPVSTVYYNFTVGFNDTFFGNDTVLNTLYSPDITPKNIRFISGNFGCYDTIIKPLKLLTPFPLVGCLLFDNSGLASCFPPAKFGFYNASTEFTQFDSLTIYSKTENKRLLVSTVPGDTVTYTFNKAGTYEISVFVFNDTSDCQVKGPVTLYIDSIIPKLIVTPQSTCLKNNMFNFFDSTKTEYAIIQQWVWRFGDGDTLLGVFEKENEGLNEHSGRTQGTFKRPTHIYKDTGTYIVQLINFPTIFTGIGSEQCSFILSDTIRIDASFASFQSDSVFCKGENIALTNLSTTSSRILNYTWVFGSDSISTPDSIPEYAFNTPGFFNLELFVSDSLNCTDSVKRNILISHPEPEFLNSPGSYITITPKPACLYDTVSFELLTNYNFYKYIWDFGDSFTDTLTTSNHKYAVAGKYPIIINMQDTNSCKNSLSFDTLQINTPPSAYFNADIFQADCPPLLVSFMDSSIGNVIQWNWAFGDTQNSDLKNPKHIYNLSGDFNVQLIVTDTSGCSDTITKNGFIKINGPYGYYFLDKDSGCVPLSVNFKGFSQNSNYYLWDFGDGNVFFNSTTGPPDSINHIYSKNGIYSPSLILKDTNNCIYIAKSIESVLAETIIADFSYSGSNLCHLSPVQFQSNVSSTFPVKYLWNFGDNRIDSTLSPVHQYADRGPYQVSLTLISSLDSACKNIIVNPVAIFRKPEILILKNDTIGCPPFTLNLKSQNPELQIPVKQWSWLLNDTSLISSDSANYFIFSTGKNKITLYYFYEDTCRAEETFYISAINKPEAGFVFTPENPTINNSLITFQDKSSGSTQWKWYFGTGDSSETQNPNYTYQKEGIFQIVQIAKNEAGCPDSLAKNIFVAPKGLVKIPEAFSPNGDGNNDRLSIFPAGISELIDFKIFNRWGEMVFQSSDINNGWDGNFKGKPQEMDTYIYYIIAKSSDTGEQIFQKGDVLLIR
ncbi:MAG: hypothetical protein A3G23_11255 [Bacteroidetes bacterium RIFCSPLOWO2_12_FULL_37_12]|nr:MAG: hypothetical protein A3G23_11255 [Bacteroidetes bacterium RIFCSPLOWO2_12_FULL_37_12]